MVRPGHEVKHVLLRVAIVLARLQGVMDAAVFASYPSVQRIYRELYDNYFVRIVDNQRPDLEGSGSLSGIATGKHSDISLSNRITTTVISDESTINPIVKTLDSADDV